MKRGYNYIKTHAPHTQYFGRRVRSKFDKRKRRRWQRKKTGIKEEPSGREDGKQTTDNSFCDQRRCATVDRPLRHEWEIGVGCARDLWSIFSGTENLLSVQLDAALARSSSGDTGRFIFFFYSLAFCVMYRYLPCVTFSTETFIAFLVLST